MNSNSQNINTGLAPQADSFKWSGSLDNKPHLLGVVTSAPDFSIPPTPASSYQNIHVVLDTIHPSSITTRTEVLSGQAEIISTSTIRTENKSLSSFSNASFTNKLDDVPRYSNRLVPDRADPEQPMARSEAALTSLKSEVAPMPAPMVQLEEFDDLAERKDRELPSSVDLSLFDETEAFESRQLRRKEWALKEEEERSWRMTREVDRKWQSNWDKVNKQIMGGSFNLSSLEDSERQWRMSRSVDQSWKSNWGLVNKQVLGRGFNLKKLEETERQWRMSRSVDSTWSSNWKSVQQEMLTNNAFFNFELEDISQWAKQLERDIQAEADRIVRNVNSLKPELEKLERSLRREAYQRLDALEEEERKYRMETKVDTLLLGQWRLVGSEIKSVVGISWSEWFDNLKMKTLKKTSRAVDKLEHLELPSLPNVSLPEISLPSLPAINLPDLKIGVVKSEATRPMYTDLSFVDFTFKSYRTPREIIDLEEAERSYRVSRGVNPVAYGLWFRLGLELKYKYSLRPTFARLGSSLAEKASNLTDKAIDTFGSLVESAQGVIASAEESFTPAPVEEFAEHKHLNIYAFTAEKVDFSFKSNRTPAYIIALEEAERASRMSKFNSNRAAYRRWNKFLVDSIPKSNLERAEGAFMNVVHKAEDGITGFFGSLANSVASSLHILESSSQPQQQPAKLVKVDPMAAANKGRVNDELLNLTVKSV